MLQFLAGFTLGNVVGMYLAQNYDNARNISLIDNVQPGLQQKMMLDLLQVPNIAKKIEAFKKDVEAKKKPPE